MMDEFDLEVFQHNLDLTIANGRSAFRGKYREELNQLVGLSRAEVDEIVPGLRDLEKYDELIVVVKEASRVNLAQAELKRHIERLGKVAVEVAKKVPRLAQLFA